jgi:transcriptional regulator with XRE-family HTH domain
MQVAPLGEQLREWRTRRRMSQMDLALDTEMSTRHLSFIETGRSKPSAAMLQRIADCLEVPHRARNALLLAAGYAPDYAERPLDSPEMAGMKTIVEHVLKGHEPYPALAVDRHWNMVSANDAIAIQMYCASRCIPTGSRRRSSTMRCGARISCTGSTCRSRQAPMRSSPRCARRLRAIQPRRTTMMSARSAASRCRWCSTRSRGGSASCRR